ncbi:Zuotin and related molecular chaperones (DnaJ superfamily), contains DNA-binding domains [Ceraceosorus bombacis]|uniref:Zuotin and related molecular chaperones (DnaJ superfamily), contains DNA-binding domains n=1 Tax=Ceraceosorus bombacis TaxID=401625 RepID=A0A0P1BI01_9BASI|nr:Zuotin and related molecular chaperones (DnaJ superfamily), contains DNA-binding domains [Ceraceosorus bombacis]
MTAPQLLPFALPSAPSGHKPIAPTSLSAPSTSTLLAAGPSYVSHVRRQVNQLTFEQDDLNEKARLDELDAQGDEEEIVDDIGDEEESPRLLKSDPKEWKSQDHYAVLGLSALRYKATPAQIKLAHRKKVLKHHPDKKAGQAGSEGTNDDSFFKCIAKAHDVLSNPERRRQFDSVDEGIDDEKVPTGKEPEAKFFDLWRPVFEREARFSNPKNGAVPELGDMDSPREHVDRLYDFFYNFDSWRTFEYLDKDVTEGDENRDHRRYIDKKNRAERARRKKEDNARLRNVVDKALASDPRIKLFKQQEKAAREAKKKGKGGAPTKSAADVEAEKKAKAEEEAKAKAESAKKEEEDKSARADAKKARDAAKKNLKKHKKALRDLVVSLNYFADGAPSASVIEQQLDALDNLVQAYVDAEEPEKVAKLREDAEGAKSDKQKVRAVFNVAAQEKGSKGKEAYE